MYNSRQCNSIYLLYDASIQVSLKMKVMVSATGISNPTVIIGNEKLEVVDKYIYLGYVLSFSKEHPDKCFWKAGRRPAVRKDTSVPKDPSLQPVCLSNNDIWCLNMGGFLRKLCAEYELHKGPWRAPCSVLHSLIKFETRKYHFGRKLKTSGIVL